MIEKNSKIGVAMLGIIFGVGAFLLTQFVSKEWMDPFVKTCGDSSESDVKVLLHEFEPKLGGTFVCVITQFLFKLSQEPAGFLTWGITIGLAIPSCLVFGIESGRAGAYGIVRYPGVLGLLSQILGISVVFPGLFVPGYSFGEGQGAVNVRRVYISVFLLIPVVFLSVILFTVDTNSYVWTCAAGLAGGPLTPCLTLLYWMFDTQPKSETSDIYKGCRASANAYTVAAILALVQWYINLYYAYISFETFSDMVSALWGSQSHPAVAFMTVDAVVLFLGLLLFLFLKCGITGSIKALLISPVLGPGAAVSLILHESEMSNAAECILSIKKLK